MPGAIRESHFAGVGVGAELVGVQAHFGEAIEADPLRDGFVAKIPRGACGAAHGEHQGGEANGHHNQRDEDFDQREACRDVALGVPVPHERRFACLR